MNISNVLIGLGLIVLAGLAVWLWAIVSARRAKGSPTAKRGAKPRAGGGHGEEP